jgi:hypothetical protein
VSRTERVSTPSDTIRIGMSRICLSWANRSRVGLSPTRPLTDAGMRIEPPPSLACAIGTAPAATSAPEPAELAPATWSVDQGVRTAPSRGCSAAALKPYSESWLLPSGISPVARYIRAKSPSRGAGWPTQESAPWPVGMPATSTLSLINVGTPAKNPPRGSRASARAWS